jgi:hypothetical protein
VYRTDAAFFVAHLQLYTPLDTGMDNVVACKCVIVYMVADPSRETQERRGDHVEVVGGTRKR